MAKFMLDERGPGSAEKGAGNKYVLAQAKVVDQAEAPAGAHAVRATYMYSGMADVAALTGDAAYVNALDKIWDNVASKKLHITGGIGARGAGEAFGENYELPNMSAYNETCAAVGNDFWNHRLFLLHADAKYIDVMERTLYNGLISGVALDGKTFFYQNPLEATGLAGKDQRSPWFGVACCPSNITRFMASVPGYVYGQRGDTLWVNLYMGSTGEIKLDNGRTVKMVQETRYPWDGSVKLSVSPDQSVPLTINVRIPGWARDEPVPTDLYRFADKSTDHTVLQVNGRPVPIKLDKGYVAVTRTWKRGDVIQLNLPMPVRRVVANDQVAADRGRVALQRGPIVYAAEWPDNPQGKVRNLMLSGHPALTAEYKADLLNGVTVVKGKAVAFAYDGAGKIIKTEQPFTAIPYYAWANRGRGEMMVWFPDNEASAKPAPYPTIATTAKVTTSRRPHGGSADAIHDGEIPAASNDHNSYFDFWPTNGTTEWVQYTFEKRGTVSECELYWFDDTGSGGVRVPASWHLLYQDGNDWKPVENLGPYGVEKNKFNKVTFKPVSTAALRVELTMQPGVSAGFQKWKVR
jgi:DUF1680 family protein